MHMQVEEVEHYIYGLAHIYIYFEESMAYDVLYNEE